MCANRFGGFKKRSPLSSVPHNPLHDLSSNCIRAHFGPTVQTVADCILIRGSVPHHPTLQQILATIRQHCRRDVNSERKRLVEDLRDGGSAKIGMGRGSEEEGYVVDAGGVRAALIVLLQHSIVRAMAPPADADDGQSHVRYRYALDLGRAALLPRHPRYVDFAREAFREEGAAIVEELLVKGRMTTREAVQAAVQCVLRARDLEAADHHVTDVDADDNADANDKDNDKDSDESTATDQQKMQLSQKVIDSMQQLVEKGFLEQVQPISALAAPQPALPHDLERQDVHDTVDNYPADTIAPDFVSSDAAAGAKRTFHQMAQPHSLTDTPSPSPPPPPTPSSFIQTTLAAPPYRSTFPPGTVWRVNVQMFHASLRAFYLGRLVAERYAHRVPIAGPIVKSALKYVAHRQNSPLYADNNHLPSSSQSDQHKRADDERRRQKEERAIFTPDDIMPFLPPTTLSNLKNRAGGARSNLSSALVQLARFNYPLVVIEVEEARGHPQGGKFEIATRQLGSCMNSRILHRVVLDRCGDVAARICSILEAKGLMEADGIADGAMVPAKDVREVLNKLYRYNYVSLLNLQQSKSHNAKTSIYLWHVDKRLLQQTIQNDICRAYCNLRLRRQHETLVGKDFIERKKEEGNTDENETELDKVKYNKFILGLERLETSCLQLDETLMIMKDFQF